LATDTPRQYCSNKQESFYQNNNRLSPTPNPAPKSLGKFNSIFPLPVKVADPHLKNADADPGKNLNALNANADPDADSCSY
jgi:hypothetical protein